MVKELIQRRRLQILVHSCIYYILDESIISDSTWSAWAAELVELQQRYPEIAETACWHEAFSGFDGSTGFDLPLEDEWVLNKARYLLKRRKQNENR